MYARRFLALTEAEGMLSLGDLPFGWTASLIRGQVPLERVFQMSYEIRMSEGAACMRALADGIRVRIGFRGSQVLAPGCRLPNGLPLLHFQQGVEMVGPAVRGRAGPTVRVGSRYHSGADGVELGVA